MILSNKVGECDSSAKLTVEQPNILRILEGLKDITIDEGQPLELICKIEGQPRAIKWYKNGKEIEAPNDARLQIQANAESGVYSLCINQAVTGDGAAYRVLFTNERGEVYSGSVAHVRAKRLEPVSVPASFLTPLRDQTIQEGDTLTLKCQVNGEPQPELKWYRNGTELKADGDRCTIRLALDGTATLRLRDAQKSDSGEFRVEAVNPAGKAESKCQVRVLAEDEMPCAPKFIIPLKRTEGIPGESCDFNVKVRGIPKPQLIWSLNGITLNFNNSRFIEEDLGDGNFRLTIKEVKEEDFGQILCVAQNENGEAFCDALFEPDADWLGRKRAGEGYPPRFNVPLWDRRVPETHPMSIECHVDAKPAAEIQWFKDGELLNDADGVEIWNTPTDGTCRVKIPRFEKRHCGNYKCVAKNEHGVADTRANLNMEVLEEEPKETPKEYAPKFNPPLADAALKHGEPLHLQCHVISNPPASVLWYKDGLVLNSTERLKLKYNPESGECDLMINSVENGDMGAYRCVASNLHGSTNTACNVTVKTKKEEVFINFIRFYKHN